MSHEALSIFKMPLSYAVSLSKYSKTWHWDGPKPSRILSTWWAFRKCLLHDWLSECVNKGILIPHTLKLKSVFQYKPMSQSKDLKILGSKKPRGTTIFFSLTATILVATFTEENICSLVPDSCVDSKLWFLGAIVDLSQYIWTCSTTGLCAKNRRRSVGLPVRKTISNKDWKE